MHERAVSGVVHAAVVVVDSCFDSCGCFIGKAIYFGMFLVG